MKKFLLLFAFAIAFMGVCAQNYVALQDTLYGCRYFAFDKSTGQPCSTGSKSGTSSFSWTMGNSVEVNYYVHIPVGHCKGTIHFKPRTAKAINVQVTITNETTKKVVYDDKWTSTVAMNTNDRSETLFPDINFTQDAWYQIKLTPASYQNAPSSIKMITFQHESDLRVVSPKVFMAPSVHNNTWSSTDPNAEHANKYDYVYGEFLYPDEYAFPNRYLMCLGGSGYYCGIQVTGTSLHNKALFSAWDNGDTDKNANLPEYLRSGAVDNSDDVAINRFGNEGTGIQSMLDNAKWQRDHWVQWLLNARPETTLVTLIDENGEEQTFTYSNTILTGWYKMADDTDWHYISSLRQSGTTHLFGAAGEYSFLENYTDMGGDNFVRCYMRNRFYRSAYTGKWYNRNHMTPGHYNYNDGEYNCRYDYGHGATSLYDNCFYIEQGAFGQVNDSSMYVPLQTNTECVDTINIDNKQERINLAFRNKQLSQVTSDITEMMAASDAREQMIAYTKNILDNEGHIGSYSGGALEDLKTVFNGGDPANLTQLGNALKTLAANNNAIRYANVTSRLYVGCQRAYIFDNIDGNGILYVDPECAEPTLKVGDLDRNDPYANWIIIQSDKSNSLSVYNEGAQLFLNFDKDNCLSTEVCKSGNLARTGKGFYLGSGTNNVLVGNADGTVTLGSYKETGCQFYLHDNLSHTPSNEMVMGLVEQTASLDKFAEYVAQIPNILKAPEGVVGSWTNPEEVEQLAALYDDGNITEDKAEELYSLMDNAEKIEISDTEQGAYLILSAAEGCASDPYLTIDADNYVYHRAATTKPDQVWLTTPYRGGYKLTSQGRGLNTLSTSNIVNVTTKPTETAPAFFFTTLDSATVSISDIQYGPMVVDGTTSPLKNIASGNTNQVFYLKPATDVKVSLNSNGLQTLYLDFAVQVPEGLEVYAVADFDGNGPLLDPITTIIPARTPVILKGVSYGSYNMTIVPADQSVFQAEKEVLAGTLLKKTGLKSKSFYSLSVKSGKVVFAQAMGTSVAANQCYILKEDLEALGLTETQYPVDFNNITAVSNVAAAATATTGKAYDLQGRETSADAKGIIIKNNEKVLNK